MGEKSNNKQSNFDTNSARKVEFGIYIDSHGIRVTMILIETV